MLTALELGFAVERGQRVPVLVPLIDPLCGDGAKLFRAVQFGDINKARVVAATQLEYPSTPRPTVLTGEHASERGDRAPELCRSCGMQYARLVEAVARMPSTRRALAAVNTERQCEPPRRMSSQGTGGHAALALTAHVRSLRPSRLAALAGRGESLCRARQSSPPSTLLSQRGRGQAIPAQPRYQEASEPVTQLQHGGELVGLGDGRVPVGAPVTSDDCQFDRVDHVAALFAIALREPGVRLPLLACGHQVVSWVAGLPLSQMQNSLPSGSAIRIQVLPCSLQCVVADPLCAEAGQAVGFHLDVGNLDVEMHPILGRLWFGHSLQQQLRAGAFTGVERDVDAGSADIRVAQRLGPELGEAFGISTVQYEPEMRCRIVTWSLVGAIPLLNAARN